MAKVQNKKLLEAAKIENEKLIEQYGKTGKETVARRESAGTGNKTATKTTGDFNADYKARVAAQKENSYFKVNDEGYVVPKTVDERVGTMAQNAAENIGVPKNDTKILNQTSDSGFKMPERSTSQVLQDINNMEAKYEGWISGRDLSVDFNNKKEREKFFEDYQKLYDEYDYALEYESLISGEELDFDTVLKNVEDNLNKSQSNLSALKQRKTAGQRGRGLKNFDISDFEFEKAEFDQRRAQQQYDKVQNERVRREVEAEGTKFETEFQNDTEATRYVEEGKKHRDNMLTYMENVGEYNERYKAMTDLEKDTYNFVLGKYGFDKAQEYINSREHIWNRKANKKKIEEHYKWADENPGKAAAASFMMPLAGLSALGGGLEDAFLGLMGKEQVYDPYADDQMALRRKNAYREGSMADLGAVGKWFAQAGYSMGDVVSTMPLGPNLSLAVLGTNAAGDKFQNVLDNGGTLKQALTSGVISGAIEVFTEKIGIDNLFDMIGKPSANIAKSIAKQIGAESMEEGISAYANFLSDETILKENSEFNRYIKQLMAEGMSRKEASEKAAVEYLIKQPMLDMLAGGLSGGVLGASGAVAGRLTAGAEMGDGYAYEIDKGRSAKEGTAYQQYAEKLGYEQALREDGKAPGIWQKGKLAAEKAAYYEDSANVGYELQKEGKTANVITEALSAPEGSKTRAMAEEIKTKAESGEEVSESEIGDLYNMLTTEKFKSSGTDFSETFSRDNYTAKLLSMGEEGIGAKEISVALSDLFAGREISTAEEDTIAKNSNAREILSNETGIEIKADFTEAQKVEAAREIISAVKGEANFKSGGDLAEVIRQDAAERAQANSKKDFGQAGQVAFESVLKKSTEANPDINIDALYRGYTRYYEAGRVGLKFSQIPETVMGNAISEDIRMKAFASGVADAKAESAKWRENKSGTVHFGKKARLVVNDFSRAISYQEQSDLNGLAKALGVQIEIVESVKGGQANGEYKDGVIRIAADANSPLLTTVAHEAVHRLKEMDIKAYNRLAKYVAQNYLMKGDSRRGSIAKATQKAYGEAGVELTLSEATEENVADFLANLVENRAEIRKLAGADLTLAQKVYKALREVFEKVKAFFSGRSVDNAEIKKRYKALQMFEQEIARAKNNAKENLPDNKKDTSDNKVTAKYYINPDFETEYNKWVEDGKPNRRTLTVGRTSEALKSINVKDQEIKWDTSKINTILKEHLAMNDDTMKQVPALLENPIIIMKSLKSESRLTIMGELYDSKGTPVLAVIELLPTNKKQTMVLDEIKVVSAYGKDSTQTLINNSDIYYVEQNKKRTDTWLKLNRLQLPLSVTKYGPIKMVTYPGENSKGFYEFSSKDFENEKTDMAIALENAGIDSSIFEKEGKYSLKITADDVKAVQSIPRKSVNQFTSEDIKKTESFARKYFEEMGVKSPFFRAWFGDWRAKDSTPVEVATEKGSDRVSIKNNDTGWNIQVSGKVFSESGHKATNNRAAEPYLKYINSIAEKAILLDSEAIPAEKAKSENSVMMHSLYAVADIGNGRELLKLYVEELNDVNSDGTISRAYQLQNIENQQLKSSEFKQSFSSINSTADINTVSDLFEVVKIKDKKFKPNPTSLILNEDGTPKVVYHGSSENFEAFDITKSRSWEGTPDYDLPGFYFSESTEESGGYGDIKPYYIHISNPYNGDIYALAKEKGSYRNAYEYLINEGYDGVIVDDMGEGFTEYIVLKAENIKSATDNIGTFDKGTTNTKYSLKGVDTLGEFNKLTEQDRALKAKLDVKDRLIMDRRATMGQARRMVKDFGSRAKAGDVEEKIYALYNKMLRGGDSKGPMAFNDFQKEARGIASEILKNVSVVDAYAKERYDDFLSNLKGRTIYISAADAADISDYNDFRKRYVFRLNLKKVDGYMGSGDYVDTIYSELAAAYPDLISGEAQAVSDMLYEIGEVIDSLSEYTKNPFEGDNLTESMLTNEILESFFDAPQAEASEEQKTINRLVAERVKIREQERERYEKRLESIEKVRAEHRAEIKNTIKKEREKKDKAIEKILLRQEEARVKQRERMEKGNLIKGIRTAHKHLSSMLLNPTEQRFVPENLRGPVAEFLQLFDTTSTRTGARGKERMALLYTELEKIEKQNGECGALDPDLKAHFDELSEVIEEGKFIDTYSNQELLAMYKSINAVRSFIRNLDKAFGKYKAARISELGEKVIKDNRVSGGYVKGGGAKESIKGLLNFDMIDSFRFFETLGDTAEDVFSGLRSGFDRYVKNVNEIREYAAEVLKGFDVNKFTGSGAKAYRTILESGESVDMTKGEIMSLYMLSKRRQAHDHLYKGGIKIEAKKKKLEGEGKYKASHGAIKITPEDIGNIIKNLSDEEKKIAENIGLFFTETAKWGNEVSMELYGYEKFNDASYFPIKVDDSFLKKDFDQKREAHIKNSGFTKSVVKGANNPIVIEDIFDVFTSHTEKMALYNAFVLPLNDMQKVWNWQSEESSVKDSIERKFGKRALDYFDNLMKDLNGGAKGARGNEVLGMMMGKAKASAVGFSLSVVIQQPTAIIRAFAEINPKYFGSNNHSKNSWKFIKEKASIAQWKDWGYFQFDTGKRTKDIILNKKSFSDISMWGAGKGDEFGWKKIFNACEAETRALHPELEKGSDEYWAKVSERFAEVIDKTQVVDSVFHRSQMMRSPDGLQKAATAFMGEPTKCYNMLWSAFSGLKNGRISKGKLGKVIAAYGVSVVLNNALKSLVYALRDDEDEEYWKKYLAHFWDNLKAEPLNMVPIIKDIVSIFQGYDMKRIEFNGISSVISAGQNMFKEKETPQYKIINMIAAIGDLMGWSISNAKREIMTILKSCAEFSGNNYFEYLYTKQMYRLDNSENRSKFIDILYKSRENEAEFEKIKADLLKSGVVDEKYIDGQMNKRLKKDAAESKIVLSELDKIKIDLEEDTRFKNMTPLMQEEGLKKAEQYTIGEEVRDDDIYSGNLTLVEKINGGIEIGISPAEYILYELACDMARGDKQTLGVDEKYDVVAGTNLSDEQKAYLYMSKGSDSSEKNRQKYEEVVSGGEAIGLTGWEYIMFKELCRDADEAGDGNGSPTQKEVIAELSGADWLSREEKNYLMKVRWPKTKKTFF